LTAAAAARRQYTQQQQRTAATLPLLLPAPTHATTQMAHGSRIDAWDAAAAAAPAPVDLGFRRDLWQRFDRGRALGEGGFGVVRVVRSKATGAEYACKTVAKRLDVPNLPPAKQAQHLESIRREVAVLRRLRGSVNVVAIEDAYEDDEDAHIVMELCTGGELFHRIGRRHYGEQTVASYMRAVLRTLAQCHAHCILHRDVKPGNFMLLSDAEDAPLKAIDFGLAVFFDPKALPLTDLGLEGTPW
jgi:calcium-dependent protein kinase